MTTPPTWRALAARARRLGVLLDYGRHTAGIVAADVTQEFASWTNRRADLIILRTAVAAALEQLEKGR